MSEEHEITQAKKDMKEFFKHLEATRRALDRLLDNDFRLSPVEILGHSTGAGLYLAIQATRVMIKMHPENRDFIVESASVGYAKACLAKEEFMPGGLEEAFADWFRMVKKEEQ